MAFEDRVKSPQDRLFLAVIVTMLAFTSLGVLLASIGGHILNKPILVFLGVGVIGAAACVSGVYVLFRWHALATKHRAAGVGLMLSGILVLAPTFRLASRWFSGAS